MNIMDDNELLNSIVRWRVNRREIPAQNIGEILDKYIKSGLRRHRKQGRVVELWEEILPAELARHSRMVSLLRGVLKAEVEAGPYMFEMQNIRQALLEQIQQSCPGAGVNSIKLIVCNELKQRNREERSERMKV